MGREPKKPERISRPRARDAELLRRVHHFLTCHGLVRSGERLLVGVSGGPDSLALLSLLRELAPELNLSLHVLHLDHHLRGEESSADARFVADLAAAFGLPSTVERREVTRVKGRSRQEAARDIRMEFFEQERARLGASAVALGHTADDNAETILMRLVMGGGPGSLAGIRPRAARIIHPLLEVTRGELLAHLTARGLAFRNDSSNRTDIYLRNRLRHAVMPGLLAFNPAFLRHVAGLSLILRDEDELLAHLAQEAWVTCATESAERVELRLPELAPLHPAVLRRLLIRAAHGAGVPVKDLDLRHVEAMRRLIVSKSGSSTSLPGGIRAFRSYDLLVIGPSAPAPPAYEIRLRMPGMTAVDQLGMTIDVQPCRGPSTVRPTSPWTAWLDAGSLKGNLHVRRRRPGDWFMPLGMACRQKVQDHLVNAKVERGSRDAVPVICDEEKIVWLAGLRLDARAAAHEGTREAWQVTVARREGERGV